MSKICVVGSANLDIVVPVGHHPTRGETVLGGDHLQFAGGKGANQAVASSRLGAEVAFVGRVGDDGPGATLRAALVEAGIDTSHLITTAGVPSGIALITVDSDGDNAIVVSPGANARLRPDDITQATAVKDCDLVQLQLETPLETVLAAARTASGIVILDPAPAPANGLPQELLNEVDIIVPNETELAILSGHTTVADDIESVVAAAKSLRVETVVVTLGSRGALVVNDDVIEVPTPNVDVVDTTAAGDAFRSALAVELAGGREIEAAARFAAQVGAATTLRMGAQPSLPTRQEVAKLLG